LYRPPIWKRHVAVYVLAPLERFELYRLLGVVYPSYGDIQPFGDSAAGPVEQEGKRALLAFERSGDGLQKTLSFFHRQVLAATVRVNNRKMLHVTLIITIVTNFARKMHINKSMEEESCRKLPQK
ncbi:MAG: hypothetical protein AAFN93_15000, partial [Bacteroidota bacterium]